MLKPATVFGMRHRTSESSGTEQAPLLYTPDEAAARTSMTRHWLIVNARNGNIPHRRLGPRIYRFAPEDLEEIRDKFAVPCSTEEPVRA